MRCGQELTELDAAMAKAQDLRTKDGPIWCQLTDRCEDQLRVLKRIAQRSSESSDHSHVAAIAIAIAMAGSPWIPLGFPLGSQETEKNAVTIKEAKEAQEAVAQALQVLKEGRQGTIRGARSTVSHRGRAVKPCGTITAAPGKTLTSSTDLRCSHHRAKIVGQRQSKQ